MTLCGALAALLALSCAPGGMSGDNSNSANTNANDNSSACVPTPTPGANLAAPPADKLDLWRNGTHLRGANMAERRTYEGLDDTSIGPVGPSYTQEDFNLLAAYGANYVNFSIPGIFTETPPYQADPAIQTELDQLLARAAAAKLFVVISYRSGPGRAEFTMTELLGTPGFDNLPPALVAELSRNNVWTEQAAQDGWAAMWRYTAERYRDNPIVVGYDLMVEPNGEQTVQYADQADFFAKHGNTLVDWNRMYPPIVQAIRQVDTATPILVSAQSYGNIEWLPFLQTTNDARIVYTAHPYVPSDYVFQSPGGNLTYPGQIDVGNGPQQFDKAALEDYVFSRVADFRQGRDLPVAFNEYGVQRWEPGADVYLTDYLALLETHGVNHAYWVWDQSDPKYAEDDAYNFRHGTDSNNHANVDCTALRNAVVANWSLNATRPDPQ